MTETNSKRTSHEFDPNPRPSKVVRTAATQSTKTSPRKGRKKAAKPSISAETFIATAPPLHVTFTHTEPANNKSDIGADPELIGNVSLAPNTFSTGSFGWKGNKSLTIELPSSDGYGRESVQVMLSINATVIGSKPQAGQTKDAAAGEENNDESKED